MGVVRSSLDEGAGAALGERSDEGGSWPWLRDLYLSFDRRTLGFTRILLGVFLLFDLFRRTPDWLWMFSDQGVLPATHNLARPQASGWSLFNAFHTPGELWALWLVGLVTFGMLLVGYKTRFVQVLAAIYIASANGRVLLIENGGYVVQNLLLLWTAFLPLGERFSIDSLQRSWQRQERGAQDLNDWPSRLTPQQQRPHVSLLGAVLVLQLAALYFFNVVHKTGPAWSNGTAVHYVLYNDRMATPLVAAVRDHLPNALIFFLSKLVMVLEAAVPICLLSPLARVWSRRFVIAGIFMLHIGFGSSFVLGPFAWSLCVFASLFVSKEDWELLTRVMRRPRRALTLHYNPISRAAFWVCRLVRRADGLQLVRFEPNDSVAYLAVEQQGETTRGAAALARLVNALPLGPLMGTLIGRKPLVKVLDASWERLGARVLRVIGLHGERSARPIARGAERAQGDPSGGADFVAHWLAQPRVKSGLWLLLGGAFVAVYGSPLLDRVKGRLSQSELAGVSIGSGLSWLGGVLATVGLVMFVVSLVRTAVELAGNGPRRVLRLSTVLREGLIVLMFAAALNQALVELWVARPLRAPQPVVMQMLAHKLRYLQGWFMFSPNPVMDDGTIVVDALTVDGRHVDPFSIHYGAMTLRPPDFDLTHAKSLRYNQIWSDYFNRMHYPANQAHRAPMTEFIYRLPQRTGNASDAIVSGEVYWVHDMSPKWNSTSSYDLQRDRLFSFTNPDTSLRRLPLSQSPSKDRGGLYGGLGGSRRLLGKRFFGRQSKD